MLMAGGGGGCSVGAHLSNDSLSWGRCENRPHHTRRGLLDSDGAPRGEQGSL